MAPAAEKPAVKDIVDTAVGAGKFTVLAEALAKADLITTMKGAGPFTVFAPTDDAFAAALTALGATKEELLSREDLKAILTYHVIAGQVKSTDLTNGMSPATVNGAKVTITINGGTVKVNDAKVVTPDVMCANGVIHIIDKVILPPAPPVQYVAPLGLQLQLDGFPASFARPLSQTSGQLVKVFLPLASFDTGRWRCQSCRLDTRTVDGLAIYVLFQSGPFEVRIRSITAVKRSVSPPVPSISLGSSDAVIELLKASIKSGGSLYDKEYEELCIAIYSTSLHAIMAATGPSVATKSVACAGLINARKSSKSENAWILRHAIDAILSDIQGTPRSVQYDWLPSAQDAAGTFESCADKLENLPQDSAPLESAMPSVPETNLITGFIGPFERMGIS